MTNPIFQFFNTHRGGSERSLFQQNIETTKTYPGTEKFALPVPPGVTHSYSELVLERKSCRKFSDDPVPLSALAAILYWSMSPLPLAEIPSNEKKSFDRRPHPSGGAKFPLEAYIITDKHDKLNTAAYHYRPDTHVLEKISSLSEVEITAFKKGYVYEFVPEIPTLIVFSYIQERNVPKYGSFGTKLALIEAGHIAQNMLLIANAYNLGSVPLAGGDPDITDSLLQLDSYNEASFYTVGLGVAA